MHQGRRRRLRARAPPRQEARPPRQDNWGLDAGNTFRVEQGFTTCEADLDGYLSRVAGAVGRGGRGEGTRLYDSMADAVDVLGLRRIVTVPGC